MFMRKVVIPVLLLFLIGFSDHVHAQGSRYTATENPYFNIKLINFQGQQQTSNGRMSSTITSSRFEVYPGGDPYDIMLDFGPESAVRIDERGGLMVEKRRGSLYKSKPLAYQIDGYGRKIQVAAEFHREGNQVSMELGPYERAHVLYIELSTQENTFQSGI